MNIGDRLIRFVKGDITTVAVDAIVNAANSSLSGGGGVDGAIHYAGGPSILEECRAIVARQGKCPPGGAVITGAGRLPARRVIHAVGPVWRGGIAREAETLASAYLRSLEQAEENGLATVAFPSISTGAYGYPVREAAGIAVRTVAGHLRRGGAVREVTFVLFDDATFRAYRRAAEEAQGDPSREGAPGPPKGAGPAPAEIRSKIFRRCQEAIHASETLLEEKLYAEAISRAYYAVIHAVMLLLSDEQTTVRDPHQAEERFTVGWIAQRGLEPQLFRLFENIKRAKKGFPHNYLYTYSGEDTRDIITQAKLFLELARGHLGIGS